MEPSKKTPDQEEIEHFLTERIGAALKVAPSEIDRSRPLVSYGLDSVTAVTISGELEQWLQMRLHPGLLYDNPTIAALAEAIVALLARAAPR